MRKELLKMGLVVGLSTSLFGFTYELKDGWQQLGAVNDIDDLSVFNNQCIDYLWYYDNSGDTPEWKLHIANGNTYDYCGNSLESLKKGQGFWAKANGSCSITVGTDTNSNDCDSNMPAPPDLDNPECITCDTGNGNSSNGNNSPVLTGTSTNKAAPTEVSDSNMGHRNKSYVIMDNKTFNNELYDDRFYRGAFTHDDDYVIIEVFTPFILWTTILNQYAHVHNAELKVTNIDTNQITIIPKYKENMTDEEKSTYYKMTDILPAGTYKFEKAVLGEEGYRYDDGWFFERVILD